MPGARSPCVLALLAAGAAAAANSGSRGAAPRRQYATLTNALDPNGAFECPCLTSFPASMAEASRLLVAKGFPADYGLNGCQAYDANLVTASAKAAAGCSVMRIAGAPCCCTCPFVGCCVRLTRCGPGAQGEDDQEQYCKEKWCYVDPAVCAENKETCEAAGEQEIVCGARGAGTRGAAPAQPQSAPSNDPNMAARSEHIRLSLRGGR